MINNDDNMGLVFISESPEYCNSTGVTNLKKHNSDVFYIEFESNLQDFDCTNRNGRCYIAENVWEQMHTERIQSMMATGNFGGELGHPIPEIAGTKLSQERLSEALYDKRAFYISSPILEGNIMRATIRTSNTNDGVAFAKDILSGTIPQFSLRAFATLTNKNGKPVVNVRHICTYDAVFFPSHKVAQMTSIPELHTNSVYESVNNTFKEDAGIVIPVTEITSDLKDSNIETILESFNLNTDNIVGFSNNKTHAIIKDGNNMIYGKMSKSTVKKIKDFYNSF